MAAVKGISKLSGQAKSNTYPQPEGVLGDCMLLYGRKLGDDSLFGNALVEMGESLKQMADVKYSLDDNIKQNFLEPLHHLQTKDLKEVMVSITLKFVIIIVVFCDATIGKLINPPPRYWWNICTVLFEASTCTFICNRLEYHKELNLDLFFHKCRITEIV